MLQREKPRVTFLQQLSVTQTARRDGGHEDGDGGGGRPVTFTRC